MGNLEKLYRKALSAPNNLDFGELCALAEGAGFVLRKGKSGSSHSVYKHPLISELLTLQSRSGKAKPYQVRQLLGLIEEHELIEG